MNKTIIFVILGSLILVGGFLLYSKSGEPKIKYVTEEVKLGEVIQVVSADGSVVSVKQVDLSFGTSGKIELIDVKVGEQVTENQIIARIDNDILKARLKKAQATLTIQQEDLLLMRRKWNKIKPEEREAQKAKVEEARANVWEAEEQLKKTVIRSPIDGIIIKQNTEKGEIVSANEIIVTIIQEKSEREIEVEANVPETEVAKIEMGNSVEIILDAFGDRIFSGKVFSLEPAETNIQGVIYYKTKVVFDENLTDINIMSGMTAEVKILTAKKNDVLTLPIVAVKQKDNEKYVQLLENEEKDELIDLEIETGLVGVENIEIIKGLKQGDKVVSFINETR